MRYTLRTKCCFSSSSILMIVAIANVILHARLDVHASGTPWVVTQNGNSTRDGFKLLLVKLKGGAECKNAFIDVRLVNGLTPAEKAREVCKRINDSVVYRKWLTGTVDGDSCKIEARGPCTDIESITILEKPTVGNREIPTPGDDGSAVKDDPILGDPLYVALCDLVGDATVGQDPNATATLQVGEENPEIVVSAFGKTMSQIESELISLFNSHPAYMGLGLQAVAQSDAIRVDNVPCPLGLACGCDAENAGWLTAMLDQTSQGVQACCLASGGCQNLSAPDCILQDGTPLGSGASCGSTDCSGACCLPGTNPSCTLLTQDVCWASDGTFFGVGTTCLGDQNGNGMEDTCEVASHGVPALSNVGIAVMIILTVAVGAAVLRRRSWTDCPT